MVLEVELNGCWNEAVETDSLKPTEYFTKDDFVQFTLIEAAKSYMTCAPYGRQWNKILLP